ncbi:MAG TPA: hypothetical protein VM115_14825 [Vicinamibacterales bacterium]|nr:hypothetical protein [Vicinamibacterales bacterium]
MFLLALSLFLQAVVAAQTVILRTFDDDKIGAPPAGFALAAGRDAAADGWTVKREGIARVLAHEGRHAPPDSFAVAIFSAAQYQDVQVSVRLKATGGARTAGLVWKYHDAMNHYSAQLDLTKQELAVYRVVNGNRIRLEREDGLELDPDAWHALKIFQERGEIRVYLGGIRVFSERDRMPRGKATSVGIWTGGDSTVMFDDFRIEDETKKP